jgi:hypothetical protein
MTTPESRVVVSLRSKVAVLIDGSAFAEEERVEPQA